MREELLYFGNWYANKQIKTMIPIIEHNKILIRVDTRKNQVNAEEWTFDLDTFEQVQNRGDGFITLPEVVFLKILELMYHISSGEEYNIICGNFEISVSYKENFVSYNMFTYMLHLDIKKVGIKEHFIPPVEKRKKGFSGLFQDPKKYKGYYEYNIGEHLVADIDIPPSNVVDTLLYNFFHLEEDDSVTVKLI